MTIYTKKLILDWLKNHPGVEFSPLKLARELDISSNAVANNLKHMVHDDNAPVEVLKRNKNGVCCVTWRAKK